jgi:hypothetical protein
MTIRSALGGAIVTLTLVVALLRGQDRPRSPYIDKGACPFEGCTYRTWVAKGTIQLFANPGSTKPIGLVQAGERVVGLTGEVHSIPILAHAKQDIPDPSDPHKVMVPQGGAFYVIHYVGEGYWFCWYKGHLIQVENFSDHGPFPKATWWVKIRTATGLTGWAVSENNFDGQDRFG